jgi:BirA family transcriptional regulator, biotin operon repressor / biotin---[acetyl-CoA-carboxylase] ligase
MDERHGRTSAPGDGVAEWEGAAASSLAARWGVPAVHTYHRVGSTNDVAARLARQGCEAGTCVVADAQTSGRGRAGRAWVSAAGLGVWLSVVLRPGALAHPGAFPLRVGLAAAEALDPFCAPGRPMVKWPNDLVVGDRKIGGILCEAAWEGTRPAFVVVGIGVNVLHRAADFPADLAGRATSVRMVSDVEPDRSMVTGALVRAALAVGADPALDAAALAAFRERDSLRDRRLVWARDGGVETRGTGRGIEADGALLLQSDDSGIVRVRDGMVRVEASARTTGVAPEGAAR